MNARETYTPPTADDGTVLLFRPDLGAAVYLHPKTGAIYLDAGNGQFLRTERRAEMGDGNDFPTDRPRGRVSYGVDLSAEGYA